MHQAPVPPDRECSTSQAEVLPTASGCDGISRMNQKQGEQHRGLRLPATAEEIMRGLESLEDFGRLVDWMAKDHLKPMKATLPRGHEATSGGDAA